MPTPVNHNLGRTTHLNHLGGVAGSATRMAQPSLQQPQGVLLNRALPARPAVGSPATAMARPPTANAAVGLIGGGQPPMVVNPLAMQQQQLLRVQGPGLPATQAAPATRPAGATVPAAALVSGRNLVISQPGMRLTVPMQTLQGMQPGQRIPTGHAGHLLFKTEDGQYQIVRVDHNASSAAGTTPASASTVTTAATSLPTQPVPPNSMHQPAPVRAPVSSQPPISAAAAARPTMMTSAAASVGAARPTMMTSAASSVGAAGSTPTPARATAAGSASGGGSGGGGGGGGMGQQMTPDTAKLKCKNFLATLLRLASEQPVVVANNVRTLIQGLIDGKVEPEVFTSKLQKELNSSPQPCLVPFLKKSLPYLQHSLRVGELTIDGVRAPPPSSSSSSSAVANVGSPSLTTMAGGRVVPGISQPSPLSAAVRIQHPAQPRQQQPHVIPPTLRHPQQPLPPRQVVSMAQLHQQRPTRPLATAPPTNNLLRTAGLNLPPPGSGARSTMSLLGAAGAGLPGVGGVKSLQPPASVIPPPKLPHLPTHPNASLPTQPALRMPPPASSTGGVGFIKKEKPAASASSAAPSNSFSTAGDEDINDVAAMGGVNLAEESQRMQGGTDMIGTQIRSCKDETFLQTGQLHRRVAKLCRDRGLDEPPSELIALMSHATQDRLKTLLEKLSVIAEHRMDVVKLEGPQYEVTQDVKGQLRFLSDLDKLERRRHEEAEREMLLRAAKSRTKTEDPEKEKLKAKAKELQRLEEEQLRHEKANNTALLAIGGPKKKLKLDGDGGGGGFGASSAMASAAAAAMGSKGSVFGGGANLMKPRTKRVHMRDMVFLMEQDKDLKRSPLLWKAYNS